MPDSSVETTPMIVGMAEFSIACASSANHLVG